jgi:hypothetical protein
VEPEVDTRRVADEQLGPFDACDLHPEAQIVGEVAPARHAREHAPSPSSLLMHRPEQRKQVRLDGELSWRLALRRLGLGPVAAVLAILPGGDPRTTPHGTPIDAILGWEQTYDGTESVDLELHGPHDVLRWLADEVGATWH